jgi:glycosyltransferase involved in cell wall biosynthesis
MLARRAVRTLRQALRRTVYGALGCVLVVALAAAVATRSWVATTVGIALITGTLLLVLRELRELRLRLHKLPERLATARERLTEQRHVQTRLAVELYDQGRALGRPFPVDLVPLVLRPLIARGDALAADDLGRRVDLAEIPVHVLRRLRDNLQRRGYLDRALRVAEFCTAGGNDDDRRVEAMLRGEIAVASGAYMPYVEPRTPDGAPVPGRVLHLVGKSLPHSQAGYTIRTHYIAMAQRDAGLDPQVVTQTGFAPGSGTSETVDGIVYHRLPGPEVKSTPLDVWLEQHVAQTAELVRTLRPAILHAASDYLNALTAEAIGAAYGIPVVYESRGFWEETYLSRQLQRYGWDLAQLAGSYGLPDFYLRRREVEDRVRRAADRVVTLADVMADRIVEGGVPRERITVVPNAVDVSAFPVLERNAELAGRLGIAPGTVVIGYISSLAEYEGIDTLVAAYGRVRAATGTPVALLVVGDGPVLPELRAAAEDLGGVHFTGQVPHDTVLDYYSLIDVFVVPRRPVEVCHLVTPLKPFEAFSTGRTVVLSDVRALAAIARQSGAAELFRAGDVESLTEVLLELIADPDRRRRLAEAGAQWVRAERTWAANAQIYLRLYDEMQGAVAIGSARSAGEPASARTSR